MLFLQNIEFEWKFSECTCSEHAKLKFDHVILCANFKFFPWQSSNCRNKRFSIHCLAQLRTGSTRYVQLKQSEIRPDPNPKSNSQHLGRWQWRINKKSVDYRPSQLFGRSWNVRKTRRWLWSFVQRYLWKFWAEFMWIQKFVVVKQRNFGFYFF
jgi:hypothetical protein